MRRIDVAFWTKIALTSLFVNIPLAVGMVVYGLHPVLAFGFSALAGMGTLVIWDDSRPTEDERTHTLEQTGRTTRSPGVRQAEELARAS